MKKEDLWYNELLVKVYTYDDMYYTFSKHTKENILELAEQYKTLDGLELTNDEVIENIIREDLNDIMGNSNSFSSSFISNGDLLYLPEENKIINRKDIKESLIQFR